MKVSDKICLQILLARMLKMNTMVIQDIRWIIWKQQ